MFQDWGAILRKFYNKGIWAQHVNLGITLPVLECLQCRNSKIYKKLISIIMTDLFKHFIRLRSWLLKVKTELNTNSVPYGMPFHTGSQKSQNALHTHTQALHINAIFCYINMHYPNSQHINTVVPSSTQQHCTWLVLHTASPETFGSHLIWKNGMKQG